MGRNPVNQGDGQDGVGVTGFFVIAFLAYLLAYPVFHHQDSNTPGGRGQVASAVGDGDMQAQCGPGGSVVSVRPDTGRTRAEAARQCAAADSDEQQLVQQLHQRGFDVQPAGLDPKGGDQ